MASLKPKLFCGVALIRREASFYASIRWNGGTAATYAITPQYLSNDRTYMVEQRLHTYRTNRTLLLFASDYSSETGDYTDTTVYCQAQVPYIERMTQKLILACFIAVSTITVQAQAEPPNAVFWKELQTLCGKAFAGTVVAAPADDTTFKDKTLVMHVRSCEKDLIRIPFVVGENRSRTWVLTRKEDRILLRHDHRHEDGKPDTVTMYGGWTTSVGMPTRQMFPADQETVKTLPAAATNVWWIDLVPGEHFSYNLRRMGSERYFSIKFDLKTAVKAPEAPWGWKD